MARHLKPKEFYAKIGKDCGVTVDIVEKVWLAIVDAVIEEVKKYGHLRLPYFCTVKRREVGDKILNIPNNYTGEIETRYVPSKLGVSFSPTKFFKEKLNGQRLSRGEIFKFRQEERERQRLEQEKERQAKILNELQNSVANAVKIKDQKFRERHGIEEPKDENAPVDF